MTVWFSGSLDWYWELPLDYIQVNTCLTFLSSFFHWPFCKTINGDSIIKILSVIRILSLKMKPLADTVCIETELFVLLEFDSTVWCVGFDHYPKKESKWFLLQHIFGMTNTQKSRRTFSRTQTTLSHTDRHDWDMNVIVTAWWFSTPEHGTQWFSNDIHRSQHL